MEAASNYLEMCFAELSLCEGAFFAVAVKVFSYRGFPFSPLVAEMSTRRVAIRSMAARAPRCCSTPCSPGNANSGARVFSWPNGNPPGLDRHIGQAGCLSCRPCSLRSGGVDTPSVPPGCPCQHWRSSGASGGVVSHRFGYV